MNERDKRINELVHWHTLQEVGDMFGLSGERIRQIAGRAWRRETMRNYAKDNYGTISNEAIGRKFGAPRRRINLIVGPDRTEVRGESALAVGTRWELWARDELERSGLEAKLMPNSSPFDILVNGWRVDVKVTTRPWRAPSVMERAPLSLDMYKWNLKNGKATGDPDFYLCIVASTLDYWLVPVEAVKRGQYQIVITPHPKRAGWKGKFTSFYKELAPLRLAKN